MTLTRRGIHSYGDSQADIRERLKIYSERNGYPATTFADAVCVCGGRRFSLLIDEACGVAVRTCEACGTRHAMADSGEFLDGASLEECECLCGKAVFEITVGLALYDDSEDAKWLYIGCRCPHCGLTACYADWKNEYSGYRTLLARV